jgi:hypothetical protein
MKKSTGLIAILMSVFICFSCAFAFSANADTIDEAVLSGADDRYVPLYTTAPDSSLKSYSSDTSSAHQNYQLYYVQTTLLALIAGYLILFKARGIDHSQKMHRRGKNND